MTTQQEVIAAVAGAQSFGVATCNHNIRPGRSATGIMQDTLWSGYQQDQSTPSVFKTRAENRDGTWQPLLTIHHLLLAWFVSPRSAHATETPPRSPHLRQRLAPLRLPAALTTLRPATPPSATARRSGAVPPALPLLPPHGPFRGGVREPQVRHRRGAP